MLWAKSRPKLAKDEPLEQADRHGTEYSRVQRLGLVVALDPHLAFGNFDVEAAVVDRAARKS